MNNKDSNELTNWYSRVPKDLLTKYNNPQFKKHLMNIPFRALLIGGSGSGKTTLVLELLSRMSKTFNLMILCCRCSDEPLYKLLKTKLDKDQLQVYENGEIPNIDDYKGFDGTGLIVFDDLINEKDQSKIEEWSIRCRKLGKGFSMMYLSQSYFKTPKTIRLQCNYIMLKKLQSTRDLNMILGDFNLGVSREKLLQLYKEATKERKNFLMVDIDNVPEHRFRINFLKILPINYDT
jgi:hypothetical protein